MKNLRYNSVITKLGYLPLSSPAGMEKTVIAGVH
jgi:hypothetical protein